MIAHDSSALLSASGTAGTVSIVCSGKNLALGVFVYTIGTADQISAVAYNGVSATRLNTSVQSNRGYMYTMYNQSSGTHNLVVTATGSINIEARAISLSGVDAQISPISGTSTSTSVNNNANAITSVVDNSVHIAGYVPDAAGITSYTGGTATQTSFAVSDPLLISPPALHTITAISAGTQNWLSVGAIFAPDLRTQGLLMGGEI